MNHPLSITATMAGLISLAAPAAGSTCRVEAAGTPPRVVELYTSEGCNSCPPADRWLSSLRADASEVIAVAFHVDYWDRLGWRDRFADPRHAERQAQQQRRSGVSYSYTPQVIVDGRDWRRWPSLPPARDAANPVRLTMQRDGDAVAIEVHPSAGNQQRLAMWWAALEDGHRSDVKAGENAGTTLRHDHVARRYGGVSPWRGAGSWRIEAPSRGEGGRSVRVVAVVIDADGGWPLQAAQLRCPPGAA